MTQKEISRIDIEYDSIGETSVNMLQRNRSSYQRLLSIHGARIDKTACHKR